MVHKGAYALIQLSNGYAKDVIDLMKRLPIVRSVEAVRGPYQLIATLATEDATALQRIEGVERVVTAVPAARKRRTRRLEQAVLELEPRSREVADHRLCGMPA
ncbi:MAG: hypothetical protein ACRDJI_08645 [Actinomycetota bacterium]